MTKHPDIGKRVKYTSFGETGFGTLMAVDCDDSVLPHIVQREDGEGWTLEVSDTWTQCNAACSQGVQDGTKNLYWVSSYELMERTIDNVKRGDWLVRDGKYSRVFDVRGEGELALVDVSFERGSKDDNDTKEFFVTYTLYELKKLGYTLEDEQLNDVVEMTLEEVAKMKGIAVEKLRIKE